MLKYNFVDLILEELTSHEPVDNPVRVVILEASRRQDEGVERARFVDALRQFAGADAAMSCRSSWSTPTGPAGW